MIVLIDGSCTGRRKEIFLHDIHINPQFSYQHRAFCIVFDIARYQIFSEMRGRDLNG